MDVPQRDLQILAEAWRREAQRKELASATRSRNANMRQSAAQLTGEAEALRLCAGAIDRLCTGEAPPAPWLPAARQLLRALINAPERLTPGQRDAALALLGVVGEDPAL